MARTNGSKARKIRAKRTYAAEIHPQSCTKSLISLTSMDAVESIKCYMGCSRQEAVGLLDRVSGYDKPEYVFPNELGSVSLKKIVDSGMMIVWSTRAYGDEESRKNANCRLFDLILSEFEFRATW